MRCPNGYRRNRKTKKCSPTNAVKVEKCPPGSRKNKKLQNRCFTPNGVEMFRGQNTEFIKMANHYIMNTPLEHVYTKTVMQKEGCNIFIIGEHHDKRNNKCHGTYEMFVGLIKYLIKKKIKKVDIMMQITEDQIKMFTTESFDSHNITNKYYDPNYLQINNVRGLLTKCINKPCPFKVHSTELTPTSLWFQELAKMSPDEVPDYVKVFKDHNIMDEIKKAQLVDPKFTPEFTKTVVNKSSAYSLLQSVNDVYTASKIISDQMKSVIVYENHSRADNLIKIFTELGYTKTQLKNRQCMTVRMKD